MGSAAVAVIGIVVLVVGAELLVRGATRLAARTGISSVVIGLTVVALGTSTPELAVSLQATLQGEPDLAVGNVVGSNIANILVVLGLSALAGGALVVAQRIVRIDVPIMIAASVGLGLLVLDGRLGRVDGLILVVGLVAYVTWTVRAARKSSDAVVAEYEEAFAHEELASGSMLRSLGLIVVGLGALVLGARWLVDGSTDIALRLGVSELVVGLTVVAVGTSAPEIATSVVAAIRGERDLAVGNAVGSNLFNLLAVLGLTAAISPSGLLVDDQALTFDLPIMVAVAIACLPVFFNGYVLNRWEGGLFVAYYGAYVGYLVLEVTEHPASELMATAFGGFVIPLSVITIVIAATRAWRRGRVSAA